MWVTGAPGAATTNSSGVAGSIVKGPHTPSAPVVFVSAAAALPLAGISRDAIDFDLRALDRTVGRRAVDDAGHAAVQDHLGLGRDRDPRRRPADNKFVHLLEGFGLLAVSRWSTWPSRMFVAPFSAGPSAVTLSGMPGFRKQLRRRAGHRGRNPSLRRVRNGTPGVTSLSPASSFVRNAPRPLYSLPSSASMAKTPWFGVPPSAARETLAGLAATYSRVE